MNRFNHLDTVESITSTVPKALHNPIQLSKYLERDVANQAVADITARIATYAVGEVPPMLLAELTRLEVASTAASTALSDYLTLFPETTILHTHEKSYYIPTDNILYFNEGTGFGWVGDGIPISFPSTS